VRRQRYQGVDEGELRRLALAGDEAAFAALVAPYRELVQTVCYRITGNEHDAEDAAQATLLAVWRNLGSFAGRSKLSTWVYRIAHNAALAVVRRRGAPPLDVSELILPVADRAPDDIVRRDAVMAALAKIPPDFRAALVLREYGDLTYEEIAEVQDVPIATVKSRISRARQAMAKLLA
jgi:RNA polymerase sigma-70 factor (ECF subfamily)